LRDEQLVGFEREGLTVHRVALVSPPQFQLDAPITECVNTRSVSDGLGTGDLLFSAVLPEQRGMDNVRL
jgi:hypothetical protein